MPYTHIITLEVKLRFIAEGKDPVDALQKAIALTKDATGTLQAHDFDFAGHGPRITSHNIVRRRDYEHERE